MWCVLCTLFVVSAWVAHSLLTGAGIEFTPWHWAGLLAWLLWTFFGAAVVWSFLDERETRAAGMSTALFAVGAVAFAVALLTLTRALGVR